MGLSKTLRRIGETSFKESEKVPQRTFVETGRLTVQWTMLGYRAGLGSLLGFIALTGTVLGTFPILTHLIITTIPYSTNRDTERGEEFCQDHTTHKQ